MKRAGEQVCMSACSHLRDRYWVTEEQLREGVSLGNGLDAFHLLIVR